MSRRVPAWMEVLSKPNPVTNDGGAIRQIFLGSDLANSRLGVTVSGHTLTIGEEAALVSALGIVLVVGDVRTFGRQGR